MVWGKVDDSDSGTHYSEDDGQFTNGDIAQKHYDEVFSPKERIQSNAANALRDADEGAVKDNNLGSHSDSRGGSISEQKNAKRLVLIQHSKIM